ncbi:MAG: glycosyltransferase [Clostridia bacterium]|nr:glycosyltransferase [Clostridia bacterium]
MISVIIPVYNLEHYLKRCVASVTAQTCRDLQIILVDDGSADGSGRLCDALAQDDPRITVIHQENGGLSAARNTGLDAATGEFIAFVDGDDCIEKNMLRVLLDAITAHACDIAECKFDTFSHAPKEEKQAAGQVCVCDRQSAMRALIRNTDFRQVVWNKLYKRDVIGDLRFPAGKYHEDEFFTWRVFLRAQKIAAVDYCGYYYFQRSDSIMGVGFSQKRLDALEAMRERRDALKTAMPAVYPACCEALAENCIYQYQCFLLEPAADPDGACRQRIVRYFKENDVRAAGKTVGRKQRLWLRLFAAAPARTASLRNKLRIGF